MIIGYIDKEYDDRDTKYERRTDPREVNVVENLKNQDKIKASLPDINDDHVCVGTLQKYIETLEQEVKDLKNDKLVSEFIALMNKGGDIIVEDDMDILTALIVENDATISLNGKTITVTEDTVGDGVFHVTNGTLVITGDGCINGTGKNDYNMAIWADGGNVVINGGKFTNVGAKATEDPAHMDLIYSKNGSTVEINGGFFECATPKWTLNKHDKSESSIIVKGGTFVNYDPSNSETENPVANFVAEGYKVVSEIQDNGDILYTVVAE